MNAFVSDNLTTEWLLELIDALPVIVPSVFFLKIMPSPLIWFMLVDSHVKE
jgi:hypothetical protein